MPFIYDDTLFTVGKLMFGSSDIEALVSIEHNYKIITCSSSEWSESDIAARSLGSTTVEIGGMPMVGYKMSRIIDSELGISGTNDIALRVFNFDGSEDYMDDVLTPDPDTIINDKTTFHGNSVQIISDNRNNHILSFQKLSVFEMKDIEDAEQTFLKTNFHGMDLILNSQKRICLVEFTLVSNPISYGSFMFGNKKLVCAQDINGWSPFASIAASGSK